MNKVEEIERPVFWCKANKNHLQNVLCKKCTYVKKYINESDENFDSTQDNEPTFLSSFFHEGPIVNVETIEERLKEMNLHGVQKKRRKFSSQ